MTKWEYLRISVKWSVNEKEGVDTITANSKLVFDYDTENKDKKKDEKKSSFNLHGYINDLGKEGWELLTVFIWGNGWNETYHFKRPLEE